MKQYNLTNEGMENALKSNESKTKKWYVSGKTIFVNNKMQKNYSYTLLFNIGTKLTHGGFDKNGVKIKYPDFKPKYTPQQMLRMGVFEGKYCNDQIFEFPKEWFLNNKGTLNTEKFSPEKPNANCNYFKVKSRQSLQEWMQKKWIPCAIGDKDIRGWFEWYCRYYLGRRQPNVDIVQINRWKKFARHFAQVKKNVPKQLNKRIVQRQALLQWSWDCKI